MSASVSSGPSTPSSKGASSVGGVNALKARFETPSSSSSKSRSSPSSSEASKRSHEATQSGVSTPTVPSPKLARASPPSTPPTTSDVDPSSHTNTTMSPSQGAVSLIDPETMIENPFGQDGATTPVARSSSFMTAGTSAAATVPPSPTSSSQRYSEVSLSSPAPDQSSFEDAPQGKRSTITSAGGLQEDDGESSDDPNGKPRSLPKGEVVSQSSSSSTIAPNPASASASASARSSHRDSAQLRERMRSRLEGDEGNGSRRQSQQGIEKLRENFERLHQQHSRTHSAASATSAATASAADTGTGDGGYGDGDDADTTPTEMDVGDDGVDWDFWGRVMGNYHEVAQNHPQDLSRAIQAGIPAQLRGLCWQLLSASKDEEMELIYAYNMRQTSPHEKQIRKDLGRTFPEQEYFKDGKGVGQENLYNVVKAYSLYDEEVGYCQGMQFIVGPLLLNMPDEEAFSTLVRLMKSYGLRGHFVPNMPALQLRLFQFDRLLEDTLPLLHRHLVRHGVKTSMYASQWFMTLFSYRFPLDFVYRVLDSVFAEGIEAIFRFALALMRRNEDALINLSFEHALAYLKGSDMWDGYEVASGRNDASPRYDVDSFAREAYSVQISPFTLDGYAAEFEEQVKAANAHRREVEALRLVNRNLAARVASLEEQLQQNQTEHVDLVKDAVMSKIAKEEMEEELIRYKMLYAEASLLADQQAGQPSLAFGHGGGARASSSSASSLAATPTRGRMVAEGNSGDNGVGGRGSEQEKDSVRGAVSPVSRPASSTDAWASSSSAAPTADM